MTDDDVLSQITKLRRGDVLEVRWLSDLVPKTKALAQCLQRLNKIHDRGASLTETTTGRNSRKHLSEMVLDNLPRLRKGTIRKIAKVAGGKGGRPKKERKTSLERAEALWFDLRIPTNKQAATKCVGWNVTALFREFGKSGRPKVGRPRKDDE